MRGETAELENSKSEEEDDDGGSMNDFAVVVVCLGGFVFAIFLV